MRIVSSVHRWAPEARLACVLLLAALASSTGARAQISADFGAEGTYEADTVEVTGAADASSRLEAPLVGLLKSMANSDPSKRHVKRLLDAQESYDFSAQLSSTDILARSGFHFEVHNCTSVDGYITELVRIVNPLVVRAHLRRIPVVLYTGQGTSPAAFLAASLGRQRPARWVPHLARDEAEQAHHGETEHPYRVGPEGNLLLAETNRSLALSLANSGYDVWLVPTRGVDKQNRRRAEGRSSRSVQRILEDKLSLLKNTLPAKPMGLSQEEAAESQPLLERVRALAKSLEANDYWAFSSDEIVEYELEVQLERVRLLTRSQKLSLITYSNGGFIAFAFLASHPGYALKNLDVVINLAPAVYVNKFNLVYGLSGLLSHASLPNSPFPEENLHGLARASFVHLCRAKTLRYSLCKVLLDTLYGPSDGLYRTHLELALFDYIGRPQSVAGLRQSLQASYAGRLIHYDRGLVGNLIFYGQLGPPDYELRRVDHPQVHILAGLGDAIADEESVEKLAAELGQKPASLLKIEGFNHLDLLAAHNNALQVNAPVLQILNDRYLEHVYYQDDEGSFAAEGPLIDTSHNQLNASKAHLPPDNHAQTEVIVVDSANSQVHHRRDKHEAGAAKGHERAHTTRRR